METQGWQRHAKSRIHPQNSASTPVGQVLESIQCISVYAQYQWQQPMQMTKLSVSPLYVESPHSFQKHQESVNIFRNTRKVSTFSETPGKCQRFQKHQESVNVFRNTRKVSTFSETPGKCQRFQKHQESVNVFRNTRKVSTFSETPGKCQRFQKHQESVNYNVLQCIPNSMSDMLEQTMLQTHHRELCCTLTLDTAIQQAHRNVHASQQRLWRAKTNRTRGQATHNPPSMSD